jgi:hypothetical protein
MPVVMHVPAARRVGPAGCCGRAGSGRQAAEIRN